jgi:hypothetical protein
LAQQPLQRGCAVRGVSREVMSEHATLRGRAGSAASLRRFARRRA